MAFPKKAWASNTSYMRKRPYLATHNSKRRQTVNSEFEKDNDRYSKSYSRRNIFELLFIPMLMSFWCKKKKQLFFLPILHKQGRKTSKWQCTCTSYFLAGVNISQNRNYSVPFFEISKLFQCIIFFFTLVKLCQISKLFCTPKVQLF